MGLGQIHREGEAAGLSASLAWLQSDSSWAADKTSRGCARGGFHGRKAAAKFGVGMAQGKLRFHVQAPGQVDHGKEHVPDFGNRRPETQRRRRGRMHRMAWRNSSVSSSSLAKMPSTSGQSKPLLCARRPAWRLPAAPEVRAECYRARTAAGCAFSARLMASQLRSTWEESISCGLQSGLDRVAGGHRGLVSKNVRVAADQLAVEARDHIRDGEVPGLARHLRIKEHLQQQIAQLLAKILPMPALDGVEDLVAFLKGIFPDGVEALLAIPGAAIGAAQPGHDAHCFGEKCSRIDGRVALRAHFNNVNDALEDCAAPVTVVWLAHASPKLAMIPCIFFGLFGLLLGSFLNVCILRLPVGESVVWPRSHCRQCNQPIANRDNIPVLS